MMRRWLLLALTLPLLLVSTGCIRSVELNSDDALEASDHHGNIRIEDRRGIIYVAQSIDETDEGDYLLTMVKVIDDGVLDYQQEFMIARADVVSIRYYENNRWVVGTMLTGMSLFMIWLYYKINTSVFD